MLTTMSRFAAGGIVYVVYLAIGLALNRLFPFRDMDQWFRIFLYGTALRLAALAFLLYACGGWDREEWLPRRGMSVWMTLGGAGAMIALWSLLLTQAHGEPWSWGERALGVGACLIVGAFEEFLFRGVLLAGLVARIGGSRASLASSVLFTIFHTRPQAVAAWPHIFLTGTVFANLRLRGMGLAALAAVHAAVDSMFFFYGKEPMTGYGPVYYAFLGGLFVYSMLTVPRERQDARA